MDIPDRNMTSSNRYSKQPELNLIDYEKVYNSYICMLLGDIQLMQ